MHAGCRSGSRSRPTAPTPTATPSKAVLTLTRETAQEIRDRDGLELLLDPELSVVLFRRTGWTDDDYEAWWRRILDAQIAFVQPTSFRGEKVARLCFVNPRTTMDHVRAVLGTMA